MGIRQAWSLRVTRVVASKPSRGDVGAVAAAAWVACTSISKHERHSHDFHDLNLPAAKQVHRQTLVSQSDSSSAAL